MKNIWTCTIGETFPNELPHGADAPLRNAVAKAYKELTGVGAEFLFSGWGAELTQIQREVLVHQNEPGQVVPNETL